MKKGLIFIGFSTLFFSTMEIAIKLAGSQFNPMQLNFLRFLIGSIILSPLAIRHLKGSGFTLDKSKVLYFLFSGLMCVVVSMTFFQMAIVYAKASTVAILFSCNAVFVIPFAHFFLKEKLTKLSLVSLVVSLAGMLFIVNPENLTNVTGITLSLIAAVTFALYGIVGRKGSLKYGFDGVVQSSFSFLFGSMELLVLIWITKIGAVAGWLRSVGLNDFANIPVLQGISWGTLPMLIYLGVFVTGLGFSFYFLAMETTSASTASLVFFIKPALAPVLALLILGESITLNVLAGILLILAGSCVELISDNRQAKLEKQRMIKQPIASKEAHVR
ncbi:DMT family transporter [Sporolactobacillus terrae]|uniref:EamA family transporter n=1 Tax=Sporolactobacillus terrae TaxID=269673 RepID=A0A410D5H4_9BACL|nr:DMT family transporter [Sporolactobacillus terrae]QAA21331.1 EamA family transporter [Sporolactobacillus terrae]QAA24303.1 EamA family transporter [Sporolactobacillus terrae]UAK16106.1 DMT family transporter [Sporolactobacillus terrae]BBN97548.1 membrane protein [Sporolactobacillus terrae]